jgi:hypothetical protein
MVSYTKVHAIPEAYSGRQTVRSGEPSMADQPIMAPQLNVNPTLGVKNKNKTFKSLALSSNIIFAHFCKLLQWSGGHFSTQTCDLKKMQ